MSKICTDVKKQTLSSNVKVLKYSLDKISLGLTFLCWDRSQVSSDWMTSLISRPGTAGSSLQTFGRCIQKANP